MKTILAILILAGLASAQTHNVVLTWMDSINPTGTTYNVYKAPSTCPAAGIDPKTVTPPFSLLAQNVPALTYTDMGAISIGQSWCYYVTATLGGLESAPSNYAQAFLPVPTPVSPGNAKAVVQ